MIGSKREEREREGEGEVKGGRKGRKEKERWKGERE